MQADELFSSSRQMEKGVFIPFEVDYSSCPIASSDRL